MSSLGLLFLNDQPEVVSHWLSVVCVSHTFRPPLLLHVSSVCVFGGDGDSWSFPAAPAAACPGRERSFWPQPRTRAGGWRRSAWGCISAASGWRAGALRWRGGTYWQCAGGNTSLFLSITDDREDENSWEVKDRFDLWEARVSGQSEEEQARDSIIF